ncbi:MAG TPA: hypothetical protein VFY65_14295 [Longimicrobium sp.]|nr:hypothetical protein [Longimicrobium sp.]
MVTFAWRRRGAEAAGDGISPATKIRARRQDGNHPWQDCSSMVLDPQGQLVCLTVYKRGAVEVVRRLAA